jgi:GAF domain-containing protein
MNNDASKLLAEQLRQLVQTIQASGRAILPSSNDELLQTIVEAAARLFGAAAASIALVDEKNQTLEFRVAYGAGRAEIVGMQLPVDQGIAGYVAMTGQPLAISNVQQDPRFARDAAKKTGYVPRSILATPLLWRDRVIGVMEVLDKIAAPAFGMQDMELLALFARQAAIAIDQSQQFERLSDALVRGIKTLASADPSMSAGEIFAALERTGDASDVIELAARFYAIAALGDAERAMATRMLEAFAEYARAKKVTSGG